MPHLADVFQEQVLGLDQKAAPGVMGGAGDLRAALQRVGDITFDHLLQRRRAICTEFQVLLQEIDLFTHLAQEKRKFAEDRPAVEQRPVPRLPGDIA